MYDKELVRNIFQQISQALDKINVRFKDIKRSSDFLTSEGGIDKLDAICMMLIAVGESLKNIDKITDKKLLMKYNNIDLN